MTKKSEKSREKMKKKKTEDEKEKNIFHNEYGLFSNVFYIIKRMNENDSSIKYFLILFAVCSPIMSYLWTFISKLVIDSITVEKSIEKLIIIMAVVFLIQVVVTIINSCIRLNTNYRYISIRFACMNEKNRKVMTMPFQNLENSDVMDCYQKAGQASGSNDIGIEGMMRAIENFIVNFCVTAVGLIIMGTMNPYIVIGMTALAFFNFFIKNQTNKVTKREVWDKLATWWRKDGYMQNTMTDFSAAKDIRIYGLKDYLVKKYRTLFEERKQYQKKNEKFWWITAQISNLIWFFCQIGIYAWLVYSVIYKDMTIGNFTLYLGSSATFLTHIGSLLDSVGNILQRSREVDDWRSFLDIDKESKDSELMVPKYATYTFVFDNVSFKYPKSEKYALKNLNLTVKAGERLAVVGLNGAGKSTFIKLLLRLYEPTEGRIFLNGEDVSKYNKKSYYDLFSAVFQDVHLFAFPLSENVSMDTTDRTDKERAKKCLIDAGLGEKLSTLQKGIDTPILKVIDDDGVDFSGGEKQKLALARALYKDSPIVVLDEPTAALDALAEAKLYNDFDRLIGNKTSVYISHRLSSTQFCDHVAMFKDGEMVEYGTHESLMEAKGPYSEMFEVQAQYYLEEEGENEQ